MSKKLVPFTTVTRRKLLKILNKYGEEYFLCTDGLSHEEEGFCKRGIVDFSKDDLQNLLRSVLYSAYECASDHMSPSLVYIVQILTLNGVETPACYELPTSTAMKLIRDDLGSKFLGIIMEEFRRSGSVWYDTKQVFKK